jgi:GT2 family glycosyltransferase
MNERKRISVIVLMHNKASMTKTCLEYLAKELDGLEHEVVLLDNASTEDITSVFDSASLFQQFHVNKTEENLAFSKVNNLGASKASGHWLLFLNNDVLVDPGSIKEMLSALQQDASIGIVGTKLMFPGRETVQHAGITHMLWGLPLNYGVGACATDSRVNERCERLAVTGAMFCLPKKVFLDVGGFDERYIWGVEDIDLCLKIRGAGMRVLYLPEATGIHFESATLKATRLWETNQNHRIYKNTWNLWIKPYEVHFINNLKTQGVRDVVVFGTGSAAHGLAAAFKNTGIRISAFTSSMACDEGQVYLDRPVVPLKNLSRERYDRLIVASQFYFEVESAIRNYDPMQMPIYPVCI